MKVHIDEHKCVASGQCVLVAPDVFDQRDEDGVAVLLTTCSAACSPSGSKPAS
ncbi:ferredoxin [Streptomyces canarius]